MCATLSPVGWSTGEGAEEGASRSPWSRLPDYGTDAFAYDLCHFKKRKCTMHFFINCWRPSYFKILLLKLYITVKHSDNAKKA